MSKFKAGDRVNFDNAVNSENIRSYKLSSNLEDFYKKYKNRIFIVEQYDKNDDTVSVFVEGCEYSDSHNSWLDAKAIKYVVSPVQTDVGLGIVSCKEITYTFEGVNYKNVDKEKIFEILTDRVPDVSPTNIAEVIKQLQEIEEVWGKM